MLTIHLVKVIHVDPFTFQYDIDVPNILEAEESNSECAKTEKEISEDLAVVMEDYFTFHIENDEETGEIKPKDVEVECPLENEPYLQSVVVSFSLLADVVSSGISSVSLPQPLHSSSSLDSLASTSVLSTIALSTTSVSIPADVNNLEEVKFDLVLFSSRFLTITEDFNPILWPPDFGIEHGSQGVISCLM